MGRIDFMIRRNLDHSGIRHKGDLPLFDLLDEPVRIFRTAEGFPEPGQSESVMDALAEDAAQLFSRSKIKIS